MLKLEDLGVARKEVTLSNGCRLIVFEKSGMPVSLRASFLSGSRYDPPGKEGLAHFLEHMIVAGTKKFHTKDKLAAYIEQYGGIFAASTGAEILNVDVEVGDPTDLKKAVSILHEILLQPLFEEGAIESEKGSILRELGNRKSNPREMVFEVYRKLFFQGTAVGRSTLGSEETIRQITQKDIISFYEEMFTSGRMVLIASGGIRIEEITAMAEENLLVRPSEEIIIGDNLPILREERFSLEKFLDKDQVDLIFGFRIPNIFHSDIPALQTISVVLGGGRAATLTQKLRYEKGLVYDISAMTSPMSDTGSWIIKTSTSKEKVHELLDIVCEEIKRVSVHGLTEKEVRFAKDKIIKSKRMQMQTSGSWVSFHSFRELVDKNGWTLANYVQDIMSVTPEMTRLAAEKYFIKDKWYLALCSDLSPEEIKISL